jgi:hypothetical protein
VLPEPLTLSSVTVLDPAGKEAHTDRRGCPCGRDPAPHDVRWRRSTRQACRDRDQLSNQRPIRDTHQAGAVPHGFLRAARSSAGWPLLSSLSAGAQTQFAR